MTKQIKGQPVEMSRSYKCAAFFLLIFVASSNAFSEGYTVVGRIPLPGYRAKSLLLSPNGIAYVLEKEKDEWWSEDWKELFTAVDLRGRQTLPQVLLKDKAKAIAINPNGDTVFILGNSVTPFDTNNHQILSPIETLCKGDAIGVSADGLYAYILSEGYETPHVPSVLDACIVQLHLKSGTRSQIIDLSAAFSSMVVTSNDMAYLLRYQELLPLNIVSGTAQHPIHIDFVPNSGRIAFAITPDNAWAYVVTGRDRITPIELSTRQLFPTIQVGLDPAYVAIGPDGKRAYVANHEGKSITPVDLRTRQALAPIQLDQKPSELAVSADGRLLVVLISEGRELLMIWIN
jgi:DNA-binding beta-propeller fold protein YncE